MVKIMDNEQRAEALISKYGFDFDSIPKAEIMQLINNELANFQNGSSEYVRVLCGYLFCLGDSSDVPLLNKVKYGISFDVGCMIDGEWIESLESGDLKRRKALVSDFISYYVNYFGIDNK